MAPRLHHPESLYDVKEKSGLLIEKNLYSFRLLYLRGLPVHAIYARVTAHFSFMRRMTRLENGT